VVDVKIEALERKYDDHDVRIQAIFNAIKQFLETPKPEPPKPEEPKRRIGFHKNRERFRLAAELF